MKRFQKVSRKASRTFDALLVAVNQQKQDGPKHCFYQVWEEQDSNAAVDLMTCIRFGQVRRRAKAYQRAQKAFGKQLCGKLRIPCKNWRIEGGRVVENRVGINI